MLPAPPHDASGHTWHHPDRVLFDITKRGTAAVVGGGYESGMPGFGGTLTDAEIRATLAYIKSTWPRRVRETHDRINAGG
jgi:mono/diheme cytochrome c family protein